MHGDDAAISMDWHAIKEVMGSEGVLCRCRVASSDLLVISTPISFLRRLHATSITFHRTLPAGLKINE
jgi:hypothetical protein